MWISIFTCTKEQSSANKSTCHLSLIYPKSLYTPIMRSEASLVSLGLIVHEHVQLRIRYRPVLPKFPAQQKLGEQVFCSPNFEAKYSASQTSQVTKVNLDSRLFWRICKVTSCPQAKGLGSAVRLPSLDMMPTAPLWICLSESDLTQETFFEFSMPKKVH